MYRVIPFTVLWALARPLIILAIKLIFPDLLARVKDDLKNGRETILTDSDIDYMVGAHRNRIGEAFRAN